MSVLSTYFATMIQLNGILEVVLQVSSQQYDVYCHVKNENKVTILNGDV